MSDSLGYLDPFNNLAKDAVSENIIGLRRLGIEIGIVRQIDEELRSGAVRRVRLVHHRYGSPAVRYAVPRFIINRCPRRLRLQLGRIAADDQHLARLRMMHDWLRI